MIHLRVQRLAYLVTAILCTKAYIVDPPTTAAADTVSDCSNWHVASTIETCEDIASSWLITAAAFSAYNPSLGTSCRLVLGNSYCVERNFGLTPETPETPTSSAAPTAPTATNGVATPSPIQKGMVDNCNKFYLVVKDDTCWDISTKSSITLDQLYAWNPAVGNECKSLQTSTYICIGVIGGSTSPSPTSKPTSSPSPTTPSNGVNTPSPIQSGMTRSCNKFYLVTDKDTCYDIAKANSISLDQFYAWNPAVGSTCATLALKNYVCVSIIGSTPTTFMTVPSPTTTKPWEKPPLCYFDLSKGQYICPSATPTPTKPANGIATPTPFQAGMTGNCKKFHKVGGGDTCWSITQQYKVDLNDFYKWNPGVGSSCGTLWPDNYVCVGI